VDVPVDILEVLLAPALDLTLNDEMWDTLIKSRASAIRVNRVLSWIGVFWNREKIMANHTVNADINPNDETPILIII